jgi:putative methionine-R-sulfoxide reductase with GAF domain
MRSIINRLFAPSIRGRITAAFLIVIALVMVLAVVSYLQLRQVQPYSGVIISTSSNMSYLQRLSAATAALEADLEQYQTIYEAETLDSIQKDFQEIEEAFALLKGSPRTKRTTDLQDLGGAINRLRDEVSFVLEAESTNASSGDVNRKIEDLYFDIDVAKEHQKILSANTLSDLQATAQSQSRIADNVLRQSVILGVIVIAIAVIMSLTTSRRLRAITTLTNTILLIAAGDLTRVALVESNDEIGTLAVSFNAMTSRLREMVSTLEQRVADRTRAVEISSEVSRRLSTILDEKQLALTVVEEVQRAFNYYHAHIYLYDEMEENLVMVGGTGEVGQLMLGRGHQIARGRGLVGRAAETNQVVLVPDTHADPTWLPNPLLPDTKSELAVPISLGGRVTGVLDVQHNIVNGLTQQDVDLLQSIANQVAVAVQNANLFTQAQRLADRETLVNAISQKIQTAASVEGVLQVLARELGAALKTQRVLVQVGADAAPGSAYRGDSAQANVDTVHPGADKVPPVADEMYPGADETNPWVVEVNPRKG